MTEKLYYQDPFLQEFTATVQTCEPVKGGWAVVLDRTAFYPEGGGQPADTGTLGESSVIDTQEREGEIVHTCTSPLAPGEQVSGTIHWARRFDHMQQHSGEHIVSGFICGRYHCDNVGFHMGRDLVTIDFNADIPPEDLPALEEEVNQYLWENHEVEIRVLSGEALRQAEFRSKKFIPGDVRLVAFPGADCCACCGTHVRSAAQAGPIKLLTCQKFRDGVRIEMAAGKRALDYCTAVLAQNTLISHRLSAKALDTAAAVERLYGEAYALRGRVAQLEETDFQRQAAALAGTGDVLTFQPEMAPESVRKLCDAILTVCGGRCAVFAGTDGAYKYAIGSREEDLRSLVKELNTALQGRGGGKPNFVQGSVQADEVSIRAFFQDR